MGATLIPDPSAAHGRREIGESQARLVQPKRLETVEEMADAGQGGFDPQAQPAPDYEFDQRIAW